MNNNNKPSEDSAEGTSLEVRAKEQKAIYMIPPHDYEPPLTELEITAKFGTPVIENGINFTEYAQLYLQVVRGKDSGASEKPLQSLRELENDELRSVMKANMLLLIWHDSKAHHRDKEPSFDKWVRETRHVTWKRSTINRRICHARLALMLAAEGLIDYLPSQNATAIISRLSRTEWASFCSSLEPRQEIGPSKLNKMVVSYSERNGVPLRNTPVLIPEDNRSLLAAPRETETSETSLSDSQINKVAKPGDLIPKLAEQLTAILPAYKLGKNGRPSVQRARNFLTAITAIARKVAKPTQMAKRLQFQAWLANADPVRAERVLNAAISQFYDKALSRIK